MEGESRLQQHTDFQHMCKENIIPIPWTSIQGIEVHLKAESGQTAPAQRH